MKNTQGSVWNRAPRMPEPWGRSSPRPDHGGRRLPRRDWLPIAAGVLLCGLSLGSQPVWAQSLAATDIGTLTGGTYSWANAVNADGSVVVGFGDNAGSGGNERAFRWTQAGGMVSLGTLTGGTYSWAYGVNADGSVVVGWSDTGSGGNERAFRWTQAGGMVSLGTLTGGAYSLAIGVNATGSVVVGVGDNADGQNRAIIWRTAVAQDFTNLLTSFVQLGAATTVAAQQRADWLAMALEGGCVVGGGQSYCLSVGGGATSAGGGGGYNIAGYGFSSINAGVALSPNIVAGAIASVGMGTGNTGIVAQSGPVTGFGGYLRWSGSGDYRTGPNVGAGVGYSTGGARIGRGLNLSDVEVATNRVGMEAFSTSVNAAYGFQVADNVVLSPRLGWRFEQVGRASYTENSMLGFSASYGKYSVASHIATVGLDSEIKLNATHTLRAGVGMEADISSQTPRLSGTSNIPGAASFAIPTALGRHTVRGRASAGDTFALSATESIGGNLIVYTPTYGDKMLVAARIGYERRF